ncbi:MAG: hypothetical protein ACREHD_02430, partial [Pirellulales bacterium]
QFSLNVEGRNAGVLYGPIPLMKPGLPFLERLGVFANYTVAGGLPVGSTAVCERLRLHHASEMLRQVLVRDRDLLCFDYSYTLPGTKARLKGVGRGLCIRAFGGEITAQPRGYCTLELKETAPNGRLRLVELIDVRNREHYETDGGPIRIHKRPVDFDLPDRISKLVDFLKENRCDEVLISFV